MKRRIGCWLVAALACPSVISAQGSAAATSVTLFNSGRVLVRRVLPVSLPVGSSTRPLDLGDFAPGTFTTLDPGVVVTGVRFDPSTSEEALLRRSVGRQFQFPRPSAATASATLLALDPERWRWDSSGKVIFGRPGQLQWPAELVPTASSTDVTIRSDRARQGIKVMYETSGAAWSATYRVFLGPQGRIEGTALVASGPLDLSDVEVQLLAGDVGRPAAQMQRAFAAKAAPMSEAASSYIDGVPQEQAVGEAHVYTLPNRMSFVPGVQFMVSLFDPTPARGERRLVLGGGLPFYGGFGQQQDETPVPVEVAYRFERKAGTPFGDLVLPGGGVSVFDTDNAGRMQLIGQGSIGHTPAGKELLIPTGTAFDVTAKRVQTAFSTARATVAPYSTVAMASYRVTLQNAKDSAVVVDVREDRGGEWSVIESSMPSQKRSSTRVVFAVPVAARDSAVLTYRVRVVW
jgi:hypothetical protein